jgi:diacylglycerol kinase
MQMFNDPRSDKEILLESAKDAAGLAAIIGLIWAVAAWAIAYAPVTIPV